MHMWVQFGFSKTPLDFIIGQELRVLMRIGILALYSVLLWSMVRIVTWLRC